MYYQSLTTLEQKTLELLACGQIDKQIALHLNLSHYDLRKIIRTINTKLFVTNRIQAITLGIQLGLINPTIEQVSCLENTPIQHSPIQSTPFSPCISVNTPFWNKLTHRELEILCCFLIPNIGNQQIAQKLFVSQNTVRGHLRNIYKKLKVERSHLHTTAIEIQESGAFLAFE